MVTKMALQAASWRGEEKVASMLIEREATSTLKEVYMAMR
jgi:hypothetical protein